MNQLNQVKLTGYTAGAIGRITELHATYYSQYWQLGLAFEAEVATELSAFLLRFNPKRDGFWLAVVNQTIVGSIAIDACDNQSEDNSDIAVRLRWFIVAPNYQGLGIGQLLMRQAIDFCHQTAVSQVYLWTFAGLTAARQLYDRYGFVLETEHLDNDWGSPVLHQKFVLRLQP